MKKYLIVGLGNIGEEYRYTRHNIGFLAVEHLAQQKGVSFETVRLGDVATFSHKGRTFILLKPSTFMNLSGNALIEIVNFYKVLVGKGKDTYRKSLSDCRRSEYSFWEYSYQEKGFGWRA